MYGRHVAGTRIRTIYHYLGLMGVNPRAGKRSIAGLPAFLKDRQSILREVKRLPWPEMDVLTVPYLNDRFSSSGSASGHYFHQDLFVAQKIHRAGPEVHVDVGSRVDGFVAHVASFRPIEVFDVRPSSASVDNIRFRELDITAELPDEMVGYCDSLSCLHALEHFGLGRYNDPVRIDGDVVALRAMRKMVRPGGRFYLSVPIGTPRLEINAQRVYSAQSLLQHLERSWELVDLAYVGDDGALRSGDAVDARRLGDSFGCRFGCGIFELSPRD